MEEESTARPNASTLQTAAPAPCKNILRKDSNTSLNSSGSNHNNGGGSSSNTHSRQSSSGSGQGLLLLSVANLQQRQNLPESVQPKPTQCCHTPTAGDVSNGVGTPGPESLSSNEGDCDTTSNCSSSNGATTKGTIMSVITEDMGQNASVAVNSDKAARLQKELETLRGQLKAKDEEISRLSRIREDVEAEVEDLTASLFEEAHKMVRDANVKQASAEKILHEANMTIDGLETEVAALKTLVLTSTPSQPNKHLHPQLDSGFRRRRGQRGSESSSSSSNSPSSSAKGLSASASMTSPSPGYHKLNGHSSENGGSFTSNGCNGGLPASPTPGLGSQTDEVDGGSEHASSLMCIDPGLRKDYIAWKKSPTLDAASDPFLGRIYREDIDLCLSFPNMSLSKRVRKAIQDNTLCISPVKDFNNLPRDCALLEAPVLCRYRLRLGVAGGEAETEKEEDFYICQLARNRVTAVCDCIVYLRYIQQGLVKSHVNDVYWQIMQLRRKMQVARLGFTPE